MAFRDNKKKGGLSSLGAIIPRAYPSDEPDDVAALRAFAWWSRAVPARVAKHARPVRLHQGTLIVHTATSAWASDLSFLKEQILKAIQTHAPHAYVRDLRIQVGPLPAVPPRARDLAIEPPAPPLDNVPDDVARVLAGVHGDDLRDAISIAVRTSLAQKKKDD